MQRRIDFGIGIIIIALLFLMGCSSGVSQDKYDKAVSDLAQAQADLLNRQQNVASLKAQLETSQNSLSDTQSELNDIKAICPPGDFTTVTELENWIKANKQTSTTYADEAFRAAVKVQQAALEEGYIVSIDIDGPDEDDKYTIWCTAFVGNTLYVWSPEETTVSSMDFFVK